MRIQLPLCDSYLEAETIPMGDDLLIAVWGGEAAHIGSVAICEPRQSLDDPSKTSCTSSVVNVVGHKDEQICRLIAEKVSAARGCRVVCTGGFHIDGISAAQIEEVIAAAKLIAERLSS